MTFFIIIAIVGGFILYPLFKALLGKYKGMSIIIAPVTIILYLLYYEDWIAAGCSGECNIRIDLLLTYPVLLAIFAVAFNTLIESKIDYSNQDETSDLLEQNQSVELPSTPLDFSDKYNAKKVVRIVIVFIILMVIYMFWRG